MKIKFIVVVFFLLFVFLLSFYLFGEIEKDLVNIDDRQLTALVDRVNFSTPPNFARILKGEKRVFSFHSSSNNLGIVALLLDNHGIKTSDRLRISLIDLDSGTAIYNQEYSTEKISIDYYYTFGFPSIVDSKNKSYLLEVESLNGTLDNSVSISEKTNFFLVKYSFPRAFLVAEPSEIPTYLTKKIVSLVKYLNFQDLVNSAIKAVKYSLTTVVVLAGLWFFYQKKLSLLWGELYQRNNELKKYLIDYLASKNFKVEGLLIVTAMVALLNSAYFSPLEQQQKQSIILLVLMSVLDILYIKLLFSTVKKLMPIKFKSEWSFLLIPILAFATIRMSFMDAIPIWDSAVYYHGLLNSMASFKFTFGSLLGFNWHRHPSMGFGLYSAIFQFLSPDNIYLLNLGSLLLGIVTVIAFYFIISYFFTHRSDLEKAIMTTMFAVSPLFIGVSSYFVPDYGVICFFIIGLALFLHQKHLLMSFFFLLTIFSKETGGYTYTMFALFYVLLVVLRNLPKLKIHKLANFLFYIIPGAVYFLYLLYTRGEHWDAGKPIVFFEKDCFFCFSIQPAHFVQNLWVIFILNFGWIFTFYFFVVSLFSLIFKVRRGDLAASEKQKEALVLGLTFAGFVAFFMVFVNYIIPSYMTISVFFLSFFGILGIGKITKQKNIRLAIMGTVILLLVIQNFINLDPISAKTFGTFRFGKYEIPKVGTEFAGDGLVYNTQHVYVNRLINKFHQQFNISQKDNIILTADPWFSFYLGGGGYETFVDDQTKQLTFTKSGSFRPGIYYLTSSANLPNNGYYLFYPWIENEEKSKSVLKSIYAIVKSERVLIDGYWLEVNLVEKINKTFEKAVDE